jgi:hypothetical protein
MANAATATPAATTGVADEGYRHPVHRRARRGWRVSAPTKRLQGPVPAFEAKVFDVGATCFADRQAIKTEQHGQRSVVMVYALGGEQERAERGPVHPENWSKSARLELTNTSTTEWRARQRGARAETQYLVQSRYTPGGILARTYGYAILAFTAADLRN